MSHQIPTLSKRHGNRKRNKPKKKEEEGKITKKSNMVSLTPKVAITIILIIFIIYSIGYWTSPKFESSKVRNYVSLIVQLGAVISLVMLLFDVNHKENTRQAMEAKSFALQTENAFIDLEGQFQRAYPYLAKLYVSMNPQFSELQEIPLPEVDEAKDRTMEVHMANILFQRIENVLLENPDADFSQGKHGEWLRTWISWFSSPRLREIWQESKNIFYAHETVDWIDTNLLLPHERSESSATAVQSVIQQTAPVKPTTRRTTRYIQN